MTLAVARWGTVGGIAAVTVGLALWLRALGVLSAAVAAIALQASVLPLDVPWRLDLGLDLAPLPVALAAPLALVPALRWDPLAPAIVSAVASGATTWWLFGAMRALGAAPALAAPLAVLAALHPAWLYGAASGSGSVVGAALLVLGLGAYERWRRSGDILPLAGSSFAMGAAGLARYDAFVVGLALAGLIAAGPRGERGRPAVAIGYATGVVGTLGLWIVVSGLASGDILAFIGGAREASLPPPTSELPVHALLVLVPAAAIAGVALALRRGGAPAVATLVVALAAVLAAIVSGSALSLDAVVPLVPLAALVLADVAHGSFAAAASALGAAALLLVCGAAAVAVSHDWGEGHAAVVAAVRGTEVRSWSGERDLAAALRLTTGRVLADPRVDAVPMLLTAAPERFVTIERSARVPLTAAGLGELVLVRTPTGHGATDRIARAWPTLYAGGAPWARPLGAFPASGEAAEYRLYGVEGASPR